MTAWIEITAELIGVPSGIVAVFMTAWIEITNKTTLSIAVGSCSLHDCMD